MTTVNHRYTQIDGHQIFYRESGSRQNPTLLLLHGAPASSHMFRELIPLLSDRYHVVAPDYLGFGLSDTPLVDDFDYTFDALSEIVVALLDHLGVARFAVYVQDYGAPIGWRLALGHPQRVVAVITQNGNCYADGFVDAFWNPLWIYAAQPTALHEAPLRAALSLESIRWQYVHGVSDPTVISPDTWMTDYRALQRVGNVEVQLKLFREYPTNVEMYPRVHEWFRRSQTPLLAVWGQHDQIFAPAGARAFLTDLPGADIQLLDGGHFVLESHLDAVAGLVRGFLTQLGPA